MVNANEAIGNWLNAGNVKKGEQYTIETVEVETSELTGKPVLIISFEGGTKHSFGSQKIKPLVKAYGAETDNWIGKTLEVSAIVPTQKGDSVIFEPTS